MFKGYWPEPTEEEWIAQAEADAEMEAQMQEAHRLDLEAEQAAVYYRGLAAEEEARAQAYADAESVLR